MASSLATPSFAKRKSTDGAASAAGGLRFAFLVTPLVGATFLSKFAFPPFGALGIGISIFLLQAALIVGSIVGCLTIEPRRLTLFVMLMGIIGLIQVLQPESFSAPSLLLLVAVHLPYV